MHDTGQTLGAPLRLYPADFDQRALSRELPSFRYDELAIGRPKHADKLVRIARFNILSRPHLVPDIVYFTSATSQRLMFAGFR
jgi:hypothetical protein